MSRNVYLAFGDSITAGQGASQRTLGFVRQVDEFLRSRKWVDECAVVAQPGWTAKMLNQVARTLPAALWDDARVVTLCIGSADFSRLLRPRRLSLNGNPFPPRTVLKKADEFGFYTDQLFRLIQEKAKAHVLVTTLYNPLPSFAPAGEFVAGMNSIITDLAQYYGFSLLQLDREFAHNEAHLIDGYRTGNALDLMTPLRKPILPNNAGHRLIADLVCARLTHMFSKEKGKTKIRSKSRRPAPSPKNRPAGRKTNRVIGT